MWEEGKHKSEFNQGGPIYPPAALQKPIHQRTMCETSRGVSKSFITFGQTTAGTMNFTVITK